MKDYRERWPISLSGYLFLIALGAGLYFAFTEFDILGMLQNPSQDLLASHEPYAMIGLVLLAFFALFGFYTVEPNTARVLTFLGSYVGTDRRTGLRWTLPVLIAKTEVSQRLNNFESTRSKVNDAAGNPIEIAGIVVWRVVSPASAVFNVNFVAEYVATQSEAAIRNLASKYPYGSQKHIDQGQLTLLNNPDEIAEILKENLQERMASAGIEIIEARISYLAYATEIAAAMLQRQQADALVDAREVIVEGAVGIVETALTRLEDKKIVELSATDRAHLASNLLVVLSSDQSAQPVISTDSRQAKSVEGLPAM